MDAKLYDVDVLKAEAVVLRGVGSAVFLTIL